MLPPAGGERGDIVRRSRRPRASETGGSNCPVRPGNSFRWASRAKLQKTDSPAELFGRTCAATRVRQRARPVCGNDRSCRESRRGWDGSKPQRCHTKELQCEPCGLRGERCRCQNRGRTQLKKTASLGTQS